MSHFKNPIFLLKIAKSYFTDVNRIWKIDNKQLKKYQDKSIKKIVKYAYSIPLYHDKYKEAGVHPKDIKGVDDLNKLPIITKDDIRKYYPDGIIPKGFNKNNAFLLSTSGSTGSPFYMFYDKFTTIKTLEGYVRALKAYGGNWRKSKIVLLVDLKPGSIENAAFSESISPFLKKFISLNNIKLIHVAEKIETIIDEINKFQPEFIGSDPIMFLKLAKMKNKGFGEKIKPKVMFCSGSILDKYTKNYVENAFGVRLYNIYAATEVGILAFECKKNQYYHINSDFVYLEFLNKQNKPIKENESGNIIITRLFGKGTPIVRYAGLGDLVKTIKKENDCNIPSNLMIEHIEGRKMDLVVLPDGRTIAPFHLTTIPATVMSKLNSFKILQFQIIQHKVDEIEVLNVIDDEQRNIGPSVEKIFSEIKKMFIEKTSNKVKIDVKEVNEIEKDKRTDHVSLLISHVKKE